jgi:hypothetical protein
MPIKHIATVLCDYLVADDKGHYTAINSFQNILHIGPFPSVKSPFCVIVEFQGDGEPFRITLEGPPGVVELSTGEAGRPTDLGPNQQWATVNAIQVKPGVFPEPGVYAIVLYSGDEEVHRREFGVLAGPAVAPGSTLADDEAGPEDGG